MQELYEDKYLDIKLDNNKLIYTIYNIDDLPTKEELIIIQDKLDTFLNTILESKKKFYQIFIFNEVNIIGLCNFTDRLDMMRSFFEKHHVLFQSQLYCTILVLDSILIRTTMEVIFKISPPTKPIHFTKKREKIQKFVDMYK